MARPWPALGRPPSLLTLALVAGGICILAGAWFLAPRTRQVAQVVTISHRLQGPVLDDSTLHRLAMEMGGIQSRIHRIVANPTMDSRAKASSLDALLPEAALVGSSLRQLDLETQGRIMTTMLELHPTLQADLAQIGAQARELALRDRAFHSAYLRLNNSLSITFEQEDSP
jgi:CRP-like cAMP-binding protein